MREFFEVDDVESFIRVAQNSNVIVRADPYVLANVYGMIFFIDLSALSRQDIARLFMALKEKLVVVRSAESKSSIAEFLRERRASQ